MRAAKKINGREAVPGDIVIVQRKGRSSNSFEKAVAIVLRKNTTCLQATYLLGAPSNPPKIILPAQPFWAVAVPPEGPLMGGQNSLEANLRATKQWFDGRFPNATLQTDLEGLEIDDLTVSFGTAASLTGSYKGGV